MTATPTSRLEGLTTSVAWKAPVRCATTAAITLENEQTIDGVACVEGDRVLVKDQADAIENGIYNVMANAAWERAKDFNGTLDCVGGTLVHVVHGTVNLLSGWYVIGNGQLIPGTDEINWQVWPANTPEEFADLTYLVHTQFLGSPNSSSALGGHLFDRAVTFVANWTDSFYVRTSTPSSAAQTYSVYYPSTSVASIGTFTLTTAGILGTATVGAFTSTANGLLQYVTSTSTASQATNIWTTLRGSVA